MAPSHAMTKGRIIAWSDTMTEGNILAIGSPGAILSLTFFYFVKNIDVILPTNEKIGM